MNDCVRRNDQPALAAYTKVLALTLCAYSEALLGKLVHTPHGLSLDDIEQVKLAQRENGIAEAWRKCMELASKAVSGVRSGFVPNVQRRLRQLVDEFILHPSTLRNKIAHGQMKVALNKTTSAVNTEITARLADLTFIDVERWKVAHDGLATILETMIESPHRGFPATYWTRLTTLEEEIREMEAWTLDGRAAILRKKPVPRTTAT